MLKTASTVCTAPSAAGKLSAAVASRWSVICKDAWDAAQHMNTLEPYRHCVVESSPELLACLVSSWQRNKFPFALRCHSQTLVPFDLTMLELSGDSIASKVLWKIRNRIQG